MGRKATVTDFPFKGSGTKTLKAKPSTAAKRTSNLRAADAHVSSARAAANRGKKKAPQLNSGGTLHGGQGPHPVKHLENGASGGQKSKLADFRAAAVAK